MGQEKFLLQIQAWLQRGVLGQPVVRALRFAIWRTRYGLYGWLRSSAVGLFGTLVILIAALINYAYHRQTAELLPRSVRYTTTQPFYYGNATQSVRNENPRGPGLFIVPQHLAWPSTAGSPIATPRWLVRSTELPLLYIEPGFNTPASDKAIQSFLQRIRQGECDSALTTFANSLKSHPRPLLICFAPRFDDGTRPWGSTQDSTLTAYRQTWQYLVQYFQQQQIRAVTWVWCPAKPTTITYFNPGVEYMDWIGLDVINDPARSDTHQSRSFGTLYQPLHYAIRMHPIYNVRQKPVLITNLGTTAQTEEQKWVSDALSVIHERYDEVKGAVFGNK